MRYSVTIAGRSLEVDLTGPTPLVNGDPVDAEIDPATGTPARRIRIGHEHHEILARPGTDPGFWSIGLNGRTIEVEAVDERTRAIRAMSGAVETEVARVLAAPMPGLVVRVNVEPGEAVTAGQGVVVVEAMKMENELKAPADGTVAAVEVRAGDTVEKGAVLIVLE